MKEDIRFFKESEDMKTIIEKLNLVVDASWELNDKINHLMDRVDKLEEICEKA